MREAINIIDEKIKDHTDKINHFHDLVQEKEAELKQLKEQRRYHMNAERELSLLLNTLVLIQESQTQKEK